MPDYGKTIHEQALIWDEAARTDPIYATVGVPVSKYRAGPETLPKPVAGYVLDLGCGWGRNLRMLSRASGTAVGLDISTVMLDHAKRHCAETGVPPVLVRGEASELPFKNRSFERVYSVLTLMHLSKDQARLCIAEIARILRPRGEAILTLPNLFSDIGIASVFLQKAGKVLRRTSQASVRFYTFREIQTILRPHFQTHRILAFGYYPTNTFPNSTFRWYEPEGKRTRYFSGRLEEVANRDVAAHPLKQLCKTFEIIATKGG